MTSHIQKRRRRWYATLDVPKDLRAAVGQPRRVKSLETEDRAVAERRAARLVSEWKSEFARLRVGHADDPQAADLIFFRKALSSSNSTAGIEATEELLQEYAEKMEARGEDGMTFYRRATGQLTDTLEHLEPWLSRQNIEPKTVDMKRSDVKRFAGRFPVVQTVARKDVRLWVDHLAGTEGLKPKTIGRILSALRGYWRYLRDLELIDEDHDPFANLRVERASEKQEVAAQRKAFTAEEVVALQRAAEAKKDQPLADLITLAMWTGARIEELCALKVENVHLDEAWFEIVDAKTASGWRQVPIHSALAPDMKRLVARSTDGFVMSGLTENMYGDRSNAIGKRFGRLKSSLQHGSGLVFHSIRKTVVTLLENSGAAENVVADIVGHEKATMTYGLYSGGTSIDLKSDALSKLRYPA